MISLEYYVIQVLSRKIISNHFFKLEKKFLTQEKYKIFIRLSKINRIYRAMHFNIHNVR